MPHSSIWTFSNRLSSINHHTLGTRRNQTPGKQIDIPDPYLSRNPKIASNRATWAGLYKHVDAPT